MSADCWRRNLAVLPPELAERLEGTRGEWRFEGNRLLRGDPRTVVLEDLEAEAGALVEGLAPKVRPRLVVAYSVGMFRHLELLARRWGPRSTLFLVELDLELLAAFLRATEVSLQVRLGELVLFGPRWTRAQLRAALVHEDLFAYSGTLLPVAVPVTMTDPQGYITFAAALKEEVDLLSADQGRAGDVVKVFRNVLANRDQVLESPRLEAAGRPLRGCCGVVVGSGPSLEPALPLLESCRERLVLACCDSAVGLLRRRGLEPDVAVTVDLEGRPDFLAVRSGRSTPLVTWPPADPRVLAAHGGPFFFLIPPSDLLAWFFPGLRPGPAFGPSVANLAFAALELLGCDKILLTGLDFAYGREDGLSHAPGIGDLEDPSLDLRGPGAVLHCPGNDGRPIPTQRSWTWYRRWLELQLERYGRPVLSLMPENMGAAIVGAVRWWGSPNTLEPLLAGCSKPPAGWCPTVGAPLDRENLAPKLGGLANVCRRQAAIAARVGSNLASASRAEPGLITTSSALRDALVREQAGLPLAQLVRPEHLLHLADFSASERCGEEHSPETVREQLELLARWFANLGHRCRELLALLETQDRG
ncbi:MAG: hypothetical protein A2284_08015 [Deltaproteobacteria bacterium RIFOXYA12_FULL_61_11]|nr:MAG: hypothetical protein A2284_08015 [Deltaproteobacteria bacterium RIFOXYA12_FULL_61_11]